jgi:glycogen operon protein
MGALGMLGAAKEQDHIIFRTVLEDGADASLLLYKTGTDQILREIPLADCRVMGELYQVCVSGLNTDQVEYNYRIGKKVIQDPCATLIRGRDIFGKKVSNEDGHQIRCGFACASYDWEGDTRPAISYDEAVMYTLHVRGFTMQANSKVRHKGTFRGVAEKAAYLKELGVNQVKLMPAYEFDEIVEPELYPGMSMSYVQVPTEADQVKLNYWGYKKGWYFAPKASYASGKDPAR